MHGASQVLERRIESSPCSDRGRGAPGVPWRSADRFLYVADMGLALMLGAISAEVLGTWPAAPPAARASIAVAALAIAAWLAVGPVSLAARGRLWVRAGDQARRILDETVRLVPEPPRRAVLVFTGPLESYVERIPPGNTGPYLFRHGLGAAIRMRYGRADLTALRLRAGRAIPTGAIILTFEDGQLTRAAPE